MSRWTSLVLLLTVELVIASPASAHPGWGLVHDRVRRVTYYTDLVQVWQIDASGRRTIAVPEVHTHELQLEAGGVLRGEDLEFLGGTRFRNRDWSRTPDGRVTYGAWHDAIQQQTGFVADGAGTLYWTKCDAARDRCTIQQRYRSGTVRVSAGGTTFARPLNFLAPHPDGTVLLADGADIVRLTTGGVQPIARRVSSDTGRFAIMGFSVADDRALWIAAYGDGTVIRIAPDGRREVVERSATPWKPSAVVVTSDARWIMEYDGARCRVRMVPQTGPTRVFGPSSS
jgi:hypothetical protein